MTPLEKIEALAKQYNLLLTKFYLPRRRPTEILCPHLLERLVESQQRPSPPRLVLLTAPAGFGKTSLLAALTEELTLPLTWLSLDQTDNDPLRFWSYFILALRSQLPGIGEHSLTLLHSPQTPPATEAALTALLNELSRQAGPPVLLILDDFHLIENSAIYNSLNYLLSRLPPRLRLLVASRTRPKLALARLRANDELLELGLVDLRFSFEEASEFLSEKTLLNLTNAEEATLYTTTEGWITGLKLVAFSLKNQLVQDYPAFFENFKNRVGGYRHVADYLLEEAWESQPLAIQNFLLETSILEQLNASLCAALTSLSEADCQAKLDEIERAGLFAVALDDAHNWFRQHRLFCDVLQHKLRQLRSESALQELHRRACLWYAQRELDFEALRHAILATDYAQVTTLVETRLARLLDRGENNLLLSWLELLPPALLQTHPALEMALVWVLTLNGNYTEAAPHIRNLEQTLSTAPSPESSSLFYQLEILRAHLTRLGGDLASSQAQTAALLEKIPPTDLFLRAITLLNQGMLQGLVGQTTAAAATFAQTAQLTQAGQHWYLTLLVLRLQTQQLRLSGQLRQMEQVLQIALKLAHQKVSGQNSHRPFAGFAYLGMAELLYERNELAAASDYLLQALEFGKQGGSLDILLDAYLLLVRLKFAQGQESGVWRYLAEAEQLVALTGSAQLGNILELQKVYYQLRVGQLAEAADWFEQHKFTPAPATASDYITEANYLLLARFWLLKNRPHEALTILEKLQANADLSQHTETLIKLRLLQAVAWHTTPDATDAALHALEEALCLAAPEGFVRIFLDEGVPLIGLLKQFVAHKKVANNLPAGLTFAYLRRLLVNFGAAMPLLTSESERIVHSLPEFAHLSPVLAYSPTSPPLFVSANPTFSTSPLLPDSPEELSERELEVLRLLAHGLSNQAIAQQLLLGVNTVKTHLTNLYHKLDVHSRTQAILRAKELNLV